LKTDLGLFIERHSCEWVIAVATFIVVFHLDFLCISKVELSVLQTTLELLFVASIVFGFGVDVSLVLKN
jgi:hypothetical protein